MRREVSLNALPPTETPWALLLGPTGIASGESKRWEEHLNTVNTNQNAVSTLRTPNTMREHSLTKLTTLHTAGTARRPATSPRPCRAACRCPIGLRTSRRRSGSTSLLPRCRWERCMPRELHAATHGLTIQQCTLRPAIFPIGNIIHRSHLFSLRTTRQSAPRLDPIGWLRSTLGSSDPW